MSEPSQTSGDRRLGRARIAALLVIGASLGAANAVPALAADDPSASTPAETTPAQTSTEPTTPPTPEPAPAPAPAPTDQVALIEWSDAVPPAIGFAAVRTNLEDARRNGLRVSYRVTEPVTLRADVLIFGQVVDRELKMCALPAAGPGDSLAKLTVSRTAAGASVVRIPFNVPSRRTLKKFLRITVQVRLIAADQAGNETTVYRTVALKRR